MRARFLRVVLFSAVAVGIILVPALPAQAQCTHLGQQVVCPSGVSNGSMSLFFTNGAIIWQTPAGSTASSPRAGCCPPFTAPTPTAPSATGLTPTTGAGQNALSNAVRTPSGDVVSDRASREAERQYRTEAYRWWQERAEAAEREASAAEREAQNYLSAGLTVLAARPNLTNDQLVWGAAYLEQRAREAEDRGDGEEAFRLRQSVENLRKELQSREQPGADPEIETASRNIARAAEEHRAARQRADAARRDAEEARRRLQEARRTEAEAERQATERPYAALAEIMYEVYMPGLRESLGAPRRTEEPQAQPTEQVQPAQPDPPQPTFNLRLEYRYGINQSDAANARPPAPRLP